MSCVVVNLKKEKYDVLVCRPSKWGNPYSHKENTLAKFKTKNRKESIEMYKLWITVGDGKHLLNDLHELKDKKIACFCAPKSCHADILKQLVDELYSKKISLF